MKQSWVVGCVMLYVIFQGLTMTLQASTTGDSSIWGILQSIWYLDYQALASSTSSAIWATAATVLAVFVALGQIFLMFYPALFQGVWLWYWFIVLLAVDAGMIVSVASIIRGVHSS